MVLQWQACVIENADLLCSIKAFIYWTFRPRCCMRCASEADRFQRDFGRLLLCCRYVATCHVNDADVRSYADGCNWYWSPGRWIALDHARFLRGLTQQYLRRIRDEVQGRVELRLEQRGVCFSRHWGTDTNVLRAQARQQLLNEECPCCEYHWSQGIVEGPWWLP